MSKILVIGTIAVDTVMSVDKLPNADGFAHAYTEKVFPGGSSANVAAALAGLGEEVWQAGRIADDAFGKILLEQMAKDGVHSEGVAVKRGGVTLHTYILVDAQGEHMIIASDDQDQSDIPREALPEDILEKVDVLYTDMCWPGLSLCLARECRERAIPVVFNLQNKTNEETRETYAAVRSILPYTDLFITGRETIRETMQTEDIEQGVRDFLGKQQPPAGYLLTLGTEGSLWCSGRETEHCGIAAVQPVDSTGAGDAYIAGIMHAYYGLGKPKKESMQQAAVLAALKCTQPGPRLQYDKERFEELWNTLSW